VSLSRRGAFAASGTVAMVTAAGFVALLWRVSGALNLRGITSPADRIDGFVAWGLAVAMLIVVSSLVARFWQSNDYASSRPAAVLAVAVPIVAAVWALSFNYPLWWPAWLDSELIGSIAILAGGILGVSLFPWGRGSRPGRPLVAAWSGLVLAVGCWAVLFVE